MSQHKTAFDVIVIGAGPAGLTAAYQLQKNGKKVLILEKDEKYVGGLSRTVEHKGFRFDIGGHRFYTKSNDVKAFWHEIMGSRMLKRKRLSRIYYNGLLFTYPLRLLEVLTKLPVIKSIQFVFSFLLIKIFPIKNPKSFEDWVINRFGNALYEAFFKSYTEKVWGVNCKEISSDWAAQRIKGLSLWKAVADAFFNSIGYKPKKDRVLTTLITEFQYPELGPGEFWEVCAEKFETFGGNLLKNSMVTSCEQVDGEKWEVTYKKGDVHHIASAHSLISTAPLSLLLDQLKPRPSEEVFNAASTLKYRDFITVAVMFRDSLDESFEDNWIYIHEESVKVGRVQNYKRWSESLVPHPEFVCYGLEYFCHEGDSLWMMKDIELFELAKMELTKLNLLKPTNEIIDYKVIRVPKAYPVYELDYEARLFTIRDNLEQSYENLWLSGRNGMHRYNNQDHSIMTSLIIAENLLRNGDEKNRCPWRVNQQAEYLEEKIEQD